MTVIDTCFDSKSFYKKGEFTVDLIRLEFPLFLSRSTTNS